MFYLMRHGHAVDNIVDSERVLSEKGIAEVQQTAHKVAKKQLQVQKIFHSPYKRATQSAIILSHELGLCAPQSKTGLLPNDNPSSLADELLVTDENLLFIGHMPFMGDLLTELTGKIISFQTSEMVAIEKNGDSFKLLWRSSEL